MDVLGFVACRVISKVLGISKYEHSWVDAKTIKYDKICAVSNNVSDKYDIVYTYACIKSARIEQYNSDKILMEIIQVILGMKAVIILINS